MQRIKVNVIILLYTGSVYLWFKLSPRTAKKQNVRTPTASIIDGQSYSILVITIHADEKLAVMKKKFTRCINRKPTTFIAKIDAISTIDNLVKLDNLSN